AADVNPVLIHVAGPMRFIAFGKRDCCFKAGGIESCFWWRECLPFRRNQHKNPAFLVYKFIDIELEDSRIVCKINFPVTQDGPNRGGEIEAAGSAGVRQT